MSNISNLEPQAYGSITLKTNFGDIDIELFTKQCPKATRNFVQHCIDKYYEDVIFERVEKDFIAICGDRDDINEEDQDELFEDEFNPRLRFTRRGLLATANTEKNANGPKFFLTLGPAPELQNKHTIFGRAKGNTIYTLAELNECLVDDDQRPLSEKKITEVIVSENPYPDLVPRVRLKKHDDKQSLSDEEDEFDKLTKSKPDPKSTKKLSYSSDSDEETDVSGDGLESPNRQKQQKHELMLIKVAQAFEETDDLKNEDEDDSPERSRESWVMVEKPSDELVEENTDGLTTKERELKRIREQFEELKQEIEKGAKSETLTERRRRSEEEKKCKLLAASTSSSSIKPPANLDDTSGIQLKLAGKRNRDRERETLELLDRFKKRLKEAPRGEPGKLQNEDYKTKNEDSGRKNRFEARETVITSVDLALEFDDLDKVDGDSWLQHTFVADENETRLARDANVDEDPFWASQSTSSSINSGSGFNRPRARGSYERSHRNSNPSKSSDHGHHKDRDSHRHKDSHRHHDSHRESHGNSHRDNEAYRHQRGHGTRER